MDKIYTGLDKAQEMGFPTYTDFVTELAKSQNRPWHGASCASSVYARVDFGRWLADCECGAANYVEPTVPDLYYCPTCGNETTNGAARVVIFPDNRIEIEQELLLRKVKVRLGLFGTNGALNATGKLSRSWTPGESVETLKQQREIMEHI